MKKYVGCILAVAITALILVYPHTLKAQSDQPSGKTKSTVQEMTIQGKIVKEADKYYIQGQTPPEVFTILNPDPGKLEKIIKSSKSVKIDVRIVQGDNVEIKKIGGKPYGQSKGNNEKKRALNDQKDKESYSLGYQFGQNLKQQELSIDLDVYTSGIRDALGNATPLLTQDEIKKAVSGLQTRAKAARQNAMKEAVEKNLAAGQAFLKENGNKEGVVTLPSGLQYKVIREGKGKIPTLENSVVVHYKGTLIDGSEFDSTQRQGEPVTIPIKNVIAGWIEALQLMKEGSKWQLFIPASLAYGERGPLAGNTLIFDVELLEVK